MRKRWPSCLRRTRARMGESPTHQSRRLRAPFSLPEQLLHKKPVNAFLCNEKGWAAI